MIQATCDILSKDNKQLCDKLGIVYAPLQHCKSNEIAFTNHSHSKREFEVRFMADGTFRLSTRYLGYKTALIRMNKQVVVRHDPDGRRLSFFVTLCDEEEVNSVINEMLKIGYDPNPKTERI